jgi:hypothetical protein
MHHASAHTRNATPRTPARARRGSRNTRKTSVTLVRANTSFDAMARRKSVPPPPSIPAPSDGLPAFPSTLTAYTTTSDMSTTPRYFSDHGASSGAATLRTGAQRIRFLVNVSTASRTCGRGRAQRPQRMWGCTRTDAVDGTTTSVPAGGAGNADLQQCVNCRDQTRKASHTHTGIASKTRLYVPVNGDAAERVRGRSASDTGLRTGGDVPMNAIFLRLWLEGPLRRHAGGSRVY